MSEKIEQSLDYLALGAPPEDDAADVEAHLATCAEGRAELLKMERVASLLPLAPEARDIVHYALPFGLAGDLVGAAMVRKRVAGFFAHREEALIQRFDRTGQPKRVVDGPAAGGDHAGQLVVSNQFKGCR